MKPLYIACRGALVAAVVGCGMAQTQLDLRTQSTDVDYMAVDINAANASVKGTTWPVATVLCSSGGTSIFSSLHAAFTQYFNPECSISGSVSYTDYSGQASTAPNHGFGLASFTEPVSMTRAIVSITSAFQANGGTPSITALQLSVGTLANATAYMLPVQIGYSLAMGTACSGGVGTFVLAAPVRPANQTATVVVSGSNPSNYNGTFSATWTSSTTFTAPMTCASWVSGGMAGLQGLIAGNFAALPQAMSGSDTAYLWLTETNTNPANFTNLTAGAVKVMMGGVQLQ